MSCRIQFTQYPRTLRSETMFLANVFSGLGPTTIPNSHRDQKGEGRWSRRVVSRSSPELTSGSSRPSLSIRCTGKRVVSRDLAHEHRREFARRRETRTRRTHGGPICLVAFLPFSFLLFPFLSCSLFFLVLSCSFLFFPFLSSCFFPLVSFLFFPLLSSSFLFFPLLSSSFLFFPLLSPSFLFFPLLSSSFIFFHLLSSSFIFFHLLPFSFIFFHFLSCFLIFFIFFHFLSFSFIFFHVLSVSFIF